MNQHDIIAPNDVALAEHAAVIRALGKRVVGDIIEIGRRLMECKERVGHGGWLPWLEREFGWTDRTARNFIHVYEVFSAKLETVSDLEFDMRSLYLLAAPSTPEAARDAVIEAATDGRLTHVQIKKMVDKAVAEAREAERLAIEAQLEQLRLDADRREAAVRAEYAGRMFIEPAELEAEVAKAIQPWQRQNENLQKTLDDMKERERKRVENERKRRAEEAQQAERKGPIDDALSLSATAVKRGLIDLTETMTKIAPADFIKVSTQSAGATEQTLAQWLSDSPHRARSAISWLTSFVEQFEGVQ